ncbi:hypothetical protein [Acinetobacter sp. ANC 3813]|uniref:hypothetical protein n=1 Tax=Acinetobacter sp. ANC 3813 TaxID=1977873 RepID=UPI000A33410E|nr:hypothetical protein [Acinetobacter sp. ANC 3813]OTG87924.1 hypothetical protein B9T34_16455 [Acinetobacter sp. ANC 3813]
MSYACYTSEKNGREQGHGVPAVCDHPDCTNEIDRGMGHLCFENPNIEASCGGFYCSDHSDLSVTITEDEFDGLDDDEALELAQSYGLDEVPVFDEDGYFYICNHKPIEYKESRKWLQFIHDDESWQTWLEKEPVRAARIKAWLESGTAQFFKVKNLTEGDMEDKKDIKIRLESHAQYLEAWDLMVKLGYESDLKPHACQFLYGHANGRLGVDYFDVEGADLSSPNTAEGYFVRHDNKEVTLGELREMANENN